MQRQREKHKFPLCTFLDQTGVDGENKCQITEHDAATDLWKHWEIHIFGHQPFRKAGQTNKRQQNQHRPRAPETSVNRIFTKASRKGSRGGTGKQGRHILPPNHQLAFCWLGIPSWERRKEKKKAKKEECRLATLHSPVYVALFMWKQSLDEL